MYSSLDDIRKLLSEDALIQLTDDEGMGAVKQTRIDEAIAQADAEIDSYCGGRYSIPFPSTGSGCPDIVKKLSVDIAVYNLYSRRVEQMPEVRAERYKGAIKRLEGISKGTIGLGVDPAPSASTDGRAETNKADDNVFSREKLKGF